MTKVVCEECGGGKNGKGANSKVEPLSGTGNKKRVKFDLSKNQTLVIPRKEESTWGNWISNAPSSIVSASAEQEALEMIDSLTDCIMQSLKEDENDSHDSSIRSNDEYSLDDLLDSIASLPTLVIEPPSDKKRTSSTLETVVESSIHTRPNKKRRMVNSTHHHVPLADITCKFTTAPTSPVSVGVFF